jgi:hypothetical protein
MDKNAIFTQLMLLFFAAAGIVLLQGAWQANSVSNSAAPQARMIVNSRSIAQSVTR